MTKEKLLDLKGVKEVNYQVVDAGLYVCPDSHELYLRLQFNNRIVKIKISKSTHEAVNKLTDLATIFEIYNCNGLYIKYIKGKYCRLVVNKDDIPIKIKHITEDMSVFIIDFN